MKRRRLNIPVAAAAFVDLLCWVLLAAGALATLRRWP